MPFADLLSTAGGHCCLARESEASVRCVVQFRPPATADPFLGTRAWLLRRRVTSLLGRSLAHLTRAQLFTPSIPPASLSWFLPVDILCFSTSSVSATAVRVLLRRALPVRAHGDHSRNTSSACQPAAKPHPRPIRVRGPRPLIPTLSPRLDACIAAPWAV
jgi:hypothetical protein